MRGCLRRSGLAGRRRNRLIRQRHGLMQEAVLERDGGDDMTEMYRPMLGAMVFLASGLSIPAGLSAQGAAPPPVSSQPVPGELEMAKLKNDGRSLQMNCKRTIFDIMLPLRNIKTMPQSSYLKLFLPAMII